MFTSHCHRIAFIMALLLVGLVFMPALPARADQPADPLADVKSALRARQYDQAVAAADAALKTIDRGADEAIYLKALAQYDNKQYPAAVRSAERVIADHPDSPWRHKAEFLKARALVAQRNYKQAEAVYQAQANRLLSQARKHEIAGVIIRFADALATKPSPNDLSAPPPNYRKAYNLYSKALDMEIGRDLRDRVMYKKARTVLLAGSLGQAINDCRAYLEQFDPDWTGPVGSISRMSNRRKSNPPPPGRFILPARFHLVEAQLKANQHAVARVNAEDLLAMLSDHPKDKIDLDGRTVLADQLRADTFWLLVQSYRMPTPASHELDKAVQVTRRFLEAYPAHVRAVQAAWFIPAAYRQHGRADDAIAAYEKCIAGQGFELPPGDLATTKLDDVKKSPAELQDEWKKVGLYRIGQLRYAQKRYDQAIAVWNRYVNQHPNGPNWADCQRGIIDAEYQLAVDAVADKHYDQARQQFDKFLARHPLDARASQILFTFGQIDYAAAGRLEQDKADPRKIRDHYRRAIDQWQRLVGKYPRTEPASLALYRIGLIYEEKLGDLDQALDAYRRLNWGKYASYARARLAIMTQKQLHVATERTFRTDESPTVKLNVRNIKKLTVKQYFLDLEAYFRKTHAIGSIEQLDIDLIQPDKTWQIDVADYARYKPIEQTVEIPFDKNKAGVCLVNISSDDLEATTLVIRSDLDLIVKSSRREALVFVQDMRRNRPAKNVKLLLSDGKKIFATATTGDDGVFVGRFDELKNLNRLGVFAVADGSIASNRLNLSGLGFSTGLSPRGYLYTDRPAYQPGQTVRFRGILRDVKNGAYLAPEGQTYLVSITDPAGRLLWQQPQTLSHFGTFCADFTLDDKAPPGPYTLTARHAEEPARTYSARFVVQQFQLEKMKLDLSTDRRVYFRGEQVQLTIHAAYYWGQPVPDKPVRYTLPDGRTVVQPTDADGKLIVTFDTTGLRPGTAMRFAAAIEGENVAAVHTASLARQGFDIAVKPARDLVIAGEPFDVTVTTTAPDGKPVAKPVKLFVLRRSTPKPDPVLAGVPWIKAPAPAAQELTVEEKTVTTDDETGQAVVHLKLKKGGTYTLRATGEDRFKQVVTAQAHVRISDDDDDVKLRFFASSNTLKVGARAVVRLHARVAAKLALFTVEGESLIHYRVAPLKTGYNPITLNVGHEHYPNFRLAVAVMDGRRLRTAAIPFTVERQLNVTVKPLAPAYAPGAPGKVQLLVTDQLGKPVIGELSLALVDEALFAAFADPTPKIGDFFQKGAHRHAEFRAASTCDFHYDATTRPVVKAYLAEARRMAQAQTEARLIDRLNGQVLAQAAAIPRPTTAMAPQFALRKSQREEDLELEKETKLIESNAMGTAEKRVDRFYGIGAKERAKKAYKGATDHGAARPRREMPAAGWWSGSIVTDKNGKAVVDLPLPETTTQWRLTARGVTVETLVGQATANVITRKDFFIALKAPRQLMAGDRVQLLARVHNLTDYAGPVKLTLTVLGGNTETTRPLLERTAKATIDKEGTTEILLAPFEAPADRATVTMRVRATAGQHVDALEIAVPVQPWGLPFADQAGGVASTDATAFVELPKDRPYTARWLSVAVGPNLQRSVIDMALGSGPVVRPLRAENGAARCIYPPPPFRGRLPGSDLLAVVSAMQYAQAVGAPTSDVQRLTERARQLVAALVVSQRGDGAWSWTGPKDNADWSVTAMSFWALCRAKQQGIAVHAATLAKAEQYLKKTFAAVSQNDNDAKAIILHALSCHGSAEFAHANRLHRERNGLSTLALAYTALTFVNLQRNEFAAELLDVLASKAKTVRERCYWEGKTRYAWLNDQVETTAVAALAMMAARPTSPLIAQAVKELLHRRGPFGFVPAKAHGPAVSALCAYYSKGQYAQNDYTLTIQVNNQPAGTISSEQAKGGLVRIDVPTELLVDGRNKVDFHIKGRGEYAYAVALRGFSSHLKDPASWSYPRITGRYYRHAPLTYRDRPIGVASTSPVKHIEIGQRVAVTVDVYNRYYTSGYYVVEEPIPAGLMLVKGTLKGNFAYHQVQDNRIVMYYPPGRQVGDFRYELIGYATGTSRVLPTVIRDVIHPQRMRLGKSAELIVLSPGEKSDDPYQMNDAERFALGKRYFDDGVYAKALTYLGHLAQHNRTYNERDVARMLLWIYTSEGFYDARRIVDVFEVLRERYPTLEIPYDKILVVGRAYRDLGEFEQAYLVFRATIDASFINDANVSAVLEDEGQFFGSIDYQEDLWRDYPDTAAVAGAYFALSQALYQKAPQAAALAKQARRIALKKGRPAPDKMPTRIDMLTETIRLLSDYLTLYPDSPLADDAAFSMANAFLDLKQYDQVVELCGGYRHHFADSPFTSGFQYMIALGHFWQHRYDQALRAARLVAEGKSKDRDFARYILGQVYHAKHDPSHAIEWYRTVAKQYPDAKQAIDYFQAKRIAIDEINRFKPGKPVELTVNYRNIAEARCQVYRVDLMKLYLREKNLANITKVNLAGIEPLVEKTIKLGDGKDYVDKKHTVQLDLKDEGAYLVICRGDDLFTSALVLITPLKIEVQEDRVSGRVRANVINEVTGQYVPEVHVKAIGSADQAFRSGQTDLRGICIADNLHGKATVIARQGDSRYAFYRGETWLGPPPQQRRPQPDAPRQQGQLDYQQNLRLQNATIQTGNWSNYDKMRRGKNAGVQIQQTK